MRTMKALINFILFICINFNYSNSFRTPTFRRNVIHHLYNNIISYEESTPSSDVNQITTVAHSLVSTNATVTLLNLINYGDIYATKLNITDINPFMDMDISTWAKVNGCMADVRIKVTVTPHMSAENEYYTDIMGIADSRVARGLLALLCEGLSGQSAEDILSLSPRQLSQDCRFMDILPPGRLNGFENILSTIQQQIYTQLQINNQDTSVLPQNISSERLPVINDIFNKKPLSINADMNLSLSNSTNLDSIPSTVIHKEPQYHPDEVAVLLSGGVDSSVALQLLILQGYKVKAFYLKIWLEDELAHLNECPWEEDLSYAQNVCNQLNVSLDTISLQKEYWQYVVEYTLEEARQGRTPNPDVMCNSRIKFGMFYKYIGKYYYKVATGHYAQVRPKYPLSIHGNTGVSPPIITPDNVDMYLTAYRARQQQQQQQQQILSITKDDFTNNSDSISNTQNVHNDSNNTNSESISKDNHKSVKTSIVTIPTPFITNLPNESYPEIELFCSPDSIKDQTYFLCNLNQEQLAKAVFPIGHLQKSRVRELADKFNLPTRLRKDSQGICFLGKLKFDSFIEHYLGQQPGDIIDMITHETIGRHHGLWFHTIGQRKGLGPLLFLGTLHRGPWFVADKDPLKNILYITNDLQVIEKPRKEFQMHRMNWVSGQPPAELSTPTQTMRLKFKLRHGTTFSEGTIKLKDSPIHSQDNTNTPSGNIDSNGNMNDKKKGENVYYEVILDEKDKGIAPGQFTALYMNEVCLGAGVIYNTMKDDIYTNSS